MLVFHGTGGDRALIETIFAEGLTPSSRPWAHDLTGIENHVFACTTPIGSRGGDPLSFAQRRAWGRHHAWLLVIDVPGTPTPLLHGAVPNDELERYWSIRAFADSAFSQLAGFEELVETARARAVSTRDLLAYRLKSTADDLCDSEPDPHTLVQFEAAYMRASRADKARVAASYGLRIPDWFATDAHYPTCVGCMWNLCVVELEGPGGHRFSRGSWDRIDLATFAGYADIIVRWLDGRALPRTFAALQAGPLPKDRVPRTFWPDFITADLASRMRLPDTQLLLGHVGPEHIVGAIDLGTAHQLSTLVRPVDGETLPGKLMYLARQLAARRATASRPIMMD